MGKIILITGGVRSGKSAYAETLAAESGENVLYLATALPIDTEMKERIVRHREHRPSRWQTVEAYRDLDRVIQENTAGTSAIILDCVTVMLNNLIFDKAVDWDTADFQIIAQMENEIRQEFQKLIISGAKLNIPVILVTNELGLGITPQNRLSRAFLDIHGRVNQMLAEAAEAVYLCVAGLHLKIK